MSDDILTRLRDALQEAAGSPVDTTDEQRERWLGLVAEVNGHRWFVRREGPAVDVTQDAGDSAT